jgi:hypothetical protein
MKLGRTLEQKKLYYTRPHFYLKLIEDLKLLEEKVCWLLFRNEDYRNNDKLLVFGYWNEVNKILFSSASGSDLINKLTNPYDIIRQRQIIQNNLGLWPPTDPEVIEKRKTKQDAWKDWAIMRKKIMGEP